MTGSCTHVVIGPANHGVVRHGIGLARAAGSPVIRLAQPDEPFVLPPATDVVHLHVTDHLLGPTPVAAADACAGLVGRLAVPVILGLHDVPVGDDDDLVKGRDAAYRRLAEVAALVVVASSAEAGRLRVLAPGVPVEVVPLPVPGTGCRRPVGGDRRLGVLGFLYPGKGHPTVIDAAASLGAGVVAVGGCSPGHGDLAVSLQRVAHRRGVRLEITGPVPTTRFQGYMAHVGVPVVPSMRPSSSASLMSWIGAGRRPLVAANEHSVEVAERLAGHLVLFDGTADALADAAAVALADPATTWSRRPVAHEWTLAGAAARVDTLVDELCERVA